jgi:hypothetical protein
MSFGPICIRRKVPGNRQPRPPSLVVVRTVVTGEGFALTARHIPACLRKKARICRACGRSHQGCLTGRNYYCVECRHDQGIARDVARSWMALALRTGRLMPASSFRCVDCDKWAEVWEHRDYSRPLDVEPTCCSCNHLRGPAQFSLADLLYPDGTPAIGPGSMTQRRGYSLLRAATRTIRLVTPHCA